MDKMSIYWLVIMAVLIFSIRSLKLCCKKDIITVKINKKIKNIFEKILDKKKYVLAGMFFLWLYLAGGWTIAFQKDLIGMAIAMLVGALLNVIEHDEEVLIPLIVFGILMMFACGIGIIYLKMEWGDIMRSTILGSILSGWLMFFINNEKNRREN